MKTPREILDENDLTGKLGCYDLEGNQRDYEDIIYAMQAYADQQCKAERDKTINLVKNIVKDLRESVGEKEYGKTYFDIAYGSVIIELESLKLKQP